MISAAAGTLRGYSGILNSWAACERPSDFQRPMRQTLPVFILSLCAAASFARSMPEVTPVIEPMPALRRPSVVLRAPEVWREGKDAEIVVETTDVAIASVSVYVTAERTPVGGKSRGEFTCVLVPATPVGYSIEMPNVTFVRHAFKVPFYDAVRLRLIAKGFDAAGLEVARAKMLVTFVPASVPADMASGVVVSKSRQRMFALKDGVVKAAWVVSTGRRHKDGGGPTPTMVSRIHNKMRVAHSNRYAVDMRYWNAITSDGRYGIHATWPSKYPRLGTPDSHGCVRLHYVDAREFYKMAPVGWPVVVTQ